MADPSIDDTTTQPVENGIESDDSDYSSGDESSSDESSSGDDQANVARSFKKKKMKSSKKIVGIKNSHTSSHSKPKSRYPKTPGPGVDRKGKERESKSRVGITTKGKRTFSLNRDSQGDKCFLCGKIGH